MIVCIAEDRPAFDTPVKLILLSLKKHCPNISIELFYPAANDKFISWVQQRPQITLVREPLSGGSGWNIKPEALLALLRKGHDDVVWIDSDVIVTRDFRDAFIGLSQDTVVATEEALCQGHSDANAWRARAWGFEVGRTIPFTANTAVLRVTKNHIPLLVEWQKLLASDAYREAQRLESSRRPGHMFGDQDVFTALLTSREFADIPVKFFRRGADIIQYFALNGYTCAERFKHLLKRPPAFIHSQVYKPWIKFRDPQEATNLRAFVESLYLDLSPYTLAARGYRKELDAPCSWMDAQSIMAGIFRAAGMWHPPLVGMPLAAIADFVRTTNLQFAKRISFGR